MFTKRMIVSVLVTVFVLAAGAVFAQDGMSKGISVYAGGFRPTNSATKDNLGDNWLNVGLGYKLPTQNQSGSETELGIGYIGTQGKTLTVASPGTGTLDTKARIVPLTITTKTRLSEGSKLYYGGGVGAYFAKVEGLDSNGAVTAGASKTKTMFGYSILAGLDLTSRIGVELGYTGIGKVQNQNLSGYSLQLVGKF